MPSITTDNRIALQSNQQAQDMNSPKQQSATCDSSNHSTPTPMDILNSQPVTLPMAAATRKTMAERRGRKRQSRTKRYHQHLLKEHQPTCSETPATLQSGSNTDILQKHPRIPADADAQRDGHSNPRTCDPSPARNISLSTTPDDAATTVLSVSQQQLRR